jgi:hypothetical protein
VRFPAPNEPYATHRGFWQQHRRSRSKSPSMTPGLSPAQVRPLLDPKLARRQYFKELSI